MVAYGFQNVNLNNFTQKKMTIFSGYLKNTNTQYVHTATHAQLTDLK